MKRLNLALLAIAAAGVLQNYPPAIMPTRNRSFEAEHDMNDDIDLGAKDRRRAERKAHLKAAGQRAMAKE